MLDNQDLLGQTESDETVEAKYTNDQDNENTESNRNSALPNFMQRIMIDGEVLESINSLHSKQRDVFNVFHTRVKSYAKQKDVNVKPFLVKIVKAQVNHIW